MDKVEDGGPAFPHQPMDSTGVPQHDAFHGMSLRDYFAGQALAGMLCANSPLNEKDVALCCYAYANAMLLARKAGDQS